MVPVVLIVEEEGGVVRQGRGGHQGRQGAGLRGPGHVRIQKTFRKIVKLIIYVKCGTLCVPT